MKFLIIHLARAYQRKENVKTLMKSVPGDAIIVDAVDARDMTQDEIQSFAPRRSNFPPYPFQLRLTEIACFMSHRRAWSMIAEGDDPGAFVLEDDVVLTPSDFSEALALTKQHTGETEFVRFPCKLREKKYKLIAQEGGTSLFEPSTCGLGMQAQYVGRDAALRLLKATEKFDRPVDTTLQMTWLTKQVNLSVWPSGVGEISREIGGSTIGERKGFREMLYRELARPTYRVALWATLRLKAF